MKQQILCIHGGDLYKEPKQLLSSLKKYNIQSIEYFFQKKWKEGLQKDLGSKFQVILPEMPNKRSAIYGHWKVWFEKIIPFIHDDIILIGHSLGGMFLAKYLAENKFPKKIKATFLISAPYAIKNNTSRNFAIPKNLSKLSNQAGKVFLYHSTDDKVVPFKDMEKYKEELNGATVRIFKDRGHFNQEKFPELLKDIKSFK